LIDGAGAVMENAALVIDDDRILGCFQGEAPAAAPGQKATELAFPGCTILPGMIDTHVHLNLPGDGLSLEDAVREDDGVLVAISMANAVRALRAGITTVRDVGGARNTVFNVRRALALGYGEGPRVLACGQPITITGGHTWYFGGEADGVEGVRLKTRAMAKAGSDFTKVMATGGGTLNTMSWLPSYSLAELTALADESHRLGRRITAHCLCTQATQWVVEAGFDQIEHGGFLVAADGRQEFDPRAAAMVAKAGIPVTSTLAVGGYMLKEYRARQARGPLPPADQRVLDRWLRMFDENLSQFRKMREAGVTWVAGTDAGWRFTVIEGLPLEMELMREGGMSAMEAIVAGTGLAAKVIGLDDKVGTLAPGKLADIIVVGGDPLAELSRLSDVRMVMQAGRVRTPA
jgi:imidazolonepropionase-like amidohydrolase